jgi:hypothetical protein
MTSARQYLDEASTAPDAYLQTGEPECRYCPDPSFPEVAVFLTAYPTQDVREDLYGRCHEKCKKLAAEGLLLPLG